jgi:CDP-diacylglycerol--glycerol-3-phosphate 3-phosphatidyltransferase
MIYYLLQANVTGVILSYLAAAGSVLVSYIKARADASKLNANVGLLTRVERYIVLIPGLVFNLPLYVLIIIAVLANFTALQRIMRVRRDAYRQLSQSQE